MHQTPPPAEASRPGTLENVPDKGPPAAAETAVLGSAAMAKPPPATADIQSTGAAKPATQSPTGAVNRQAPVMPPPYAIQIFSVDDARLAVEIVGNLKQKKDPVFCAPGIASRGAATRDLAKPGRRFFASGSAIL